MNDLTQLAQAARELLGPAIPAGYTVIIAKAATCHPDRPGNTRGLCKSCYTLAHRNGTLAKHPCSRTIRTQADFVADYELLRSEGYTRHQIAERLGMRYTAVTTAYLNAVRAGLLTRDRTRAPRRAA
ncbi:hypothetical protein Ait01nite_089630 [Actinoplanes italicus]|uniref:Uncharacterized protein n=1 Tax=Actinoplanes italicus TaxID=113567 RepID=A0A2T0JIS5_9ACTN|nr:hypothetical protein [Actinoplanes italicus]PRX07379.1 hypothetical protein CLV67_14254 [Actinoplanes italicus]GIE35918.1 hypothetical protein Ait01nite_089630 [Actinoplanes italicus]